MLPLLNSRFGTLTAVILLAGVAGVVAIALIFLVHRLYFSVLPLWAIKNYKRTDPERLRRYLERVVATPSLIGAQKLMARGALVGIYLTQGRHAEAAAHCHANLATLAKVRNTGDFPSLEADIRRRLADCLEGLGQTDEAEEERRLAEACVDRAADDPLRHLTQGKLLERKHQYADACAAFERALSFTTVSNRPARVECMVHLVLTSRVEVECGRVDDAWAHIQEASAALANDAKLGLKCEGALSWVFAARGLADESRRVAVQVEARLADFERDPSTCRGVMYDLGMAACARGDRENGEHCWSRYLDLSPDPVHQPTALYFRAECRRHRGDTSGTLADFRAAVAMDIDTHHARLARRGLKELSGS